MADAGAEGTETPAENQHNEHVKAFFLDLASKGKDEWNKWRRDPANNDVHVTFAGVDFSEAPLDQSNFAGFEFPVDTNFSGCKWRGPEWKPLEPKFVPGRAIFEGAAFGDGAKFDGATFGDHANFCGAEFFDRASFEAATFGD